MISQGNKTLIYIALNDFTSILYEENKRLLLILIPDNKSILMAYFRLGYVKLRLVNAHRDSTPEGYIPTAGAKMISF